MNIKKDKCAPCAFSDCCVQKEKSNSREYLTSIWKYSDEESGKHEASGNHEAWKKCEYENWKNEEGVWALVGKDKRLTSEEEKWVCLQVGQTKNIGGEVDAAIATIENGIQPIERKNYVNYFGENIFEYPKDNNRYVYIWCKYMYNDLRFVLVAKEKDKEKREKIEKWFACKTRAVCWRNGGNFEDDVTQSDREEYITNLEKNLEKDLEKDEEETITEKCFNAIEKSGTVKYYEFD